MKRFLTSTCLVASSLCLAGENEIELLISSEEIAAKVSEAASLINEEYKDKQLTIIMVMKGAVCVAADLIRNLEVPFKLEYLKASSYHGMASGELTLIGLDQLNVEGRDVLIVDDIFETGNTILKIVDKVREKGPKSIKTFVLLVKDVPRKTDSRPDYVLFDIPDYFVVGYGLDYNEFYRGLPGIYFFSNNIPPK